MSSTYSFNSKLKDPDLGQTIGYMMWQKSAYCEKMNFFRDFRRGEQVPATTVQNCVKGCVRDSVRPGQRSHCRAWNFPCSFRIVCHCRAAKSRNNTEDSNLCSSSLSSLYCACSADFFIYTVMTEACNKVSCIL